jgi:hypothetical protein
MIRTKLGLLGLCAVVFGVMAFSATAAQAEVGAKWLVLKTEGGALLTEAEIETNKERLVGEIENKTASLLAKVLGLKIEILCTAGELVDALLGASGSVKTGAKVKFTGCVAREANAGLALLSGCLPHSSGSPTGTVETKFGHALVELHTLTSGVKHDVTKILPDSGEEFADILLGEECSIGEKLPVFGKLVLWDCLEEGKGALKHLVTHLVTEFKPLTKLFVISDTAEHLETSLDGSANIKLASGKSWAIKPG